mgnify:CR=1 FL=1
MKPESWKLNVGTFMSLLGSGIVLFVGITVFMFQNFQTRTQAEEQADHVKEKQVEVDNNMHELRADVKDLRNEMNQKLNLIIEMQRRR